MVDLGEIGREFIRSSLGTEVIKLVVDAGNFVMTHRNEVGMLVGAEAAATA